MLSRHVFSVIIAGLWMVSDAATPTPNPTPRPSLNPTQAPSPVPSQVPTTSPTRVPTAAPSPVPTPIPLPGATVLPIAYHHLVIVQPANSQLIRLRGYDAYLPKVRSVLLD